MKINTKKKILADPKYNFKCGHLSTCLFLFILNASVVNCLFEEYKHPTYLEARVGGFAAFNCHIDFPQEIQIPYILNWFKDEHLIFSWYAGTLESSENFSGRIAIVSDNRYGFGKASINLTSIRENDSGWYECRIMFPNRSPNKRSNGTWFHLAVDGGTLLAIPPINQTVIEHEPAFFHCSVKNPDSMFVTWFKDAQPLIEFHDLASRSTMGPDGSLLISPTIMTDLGEFECKIRNLLGEEENAKAYLNVQYKAKVVYSPAELFLPYGKPALLDCHFRSNPPLTNLRWEKDGFLYDPYNVQGVFYKRNGSLFFSKVEDSHGGRYSCTPYNDLGTEGPSPIIQVNIEHPPQFTMKPKSIYIQKLGESVEMTCSAMDKNTKDDRKLIMWTRKDGTGLPFGRHIVTGGNLTIENIIADDRGVYTCSAVNEAAKISIDTELVIETFSPRGPSNLTANSSQDAVTLQWTPNYIRPDLQYFIWYRLVDVTEWRTQEVRPSNVYETTITNLEPGMEYEFMVHSQNRYQEGIFSKTIRFMTKTKEYQEPEHLRDPILPFSQIGPPRNVTVEIRRDDYLVSWTPPEYGKESLSVYILRWYHEPDHTLHGQAETRNTYTLVNHLDNDEVYSFQVFSVSTNQYESGSNEYEILTPKYNRQMQAITIGATTALLILLAIVGITLYMKRHLFTSYHNDEKI